MTVGGWDRTVFFERRRGARDVRFDGGDFASGRVVTVFGSTPDIPERGVVVADVGGVVCVLGAAVVLRGLESKMRGGFFVRLSPFTGACGPRPVVPGRLLSCVALAA
eukprot:3772216-Rhodomonas_salina.1